MIRFTSSSTASSASVSSKLRIGINFILVLFALHFPAVETMALRPFVDDAAVIYEVRKNGFFEARIFRTDLKTLRSTQIFETRGEPHLKDYWRWQFLEVAGTLLDPMNVASLSLTPDGTGYGYDNDRDKLLVYRISGDHVNVELKAVDLIPDRAYRALLDDLDNLFDGDTKNGQMYMLNPSYAKDTKRVYRLQ